MKVKEESEKVGLKLNIQKMKIIASGPIISWQIDGETSISALLTMPKHLTVWITINGGKFLRDWNTRPPDLPLEKPICRSGSNR